MHSILNFRILAMAAVLGLAACGPAAAPAAPDIVEVEWQVTEITQRSVS